jgi:hypothetical protein
VNFARRLDRIYANNFSEKCSPELFYGNKMTKRRQSPSSPIQIWASSRTSMTKTILIRATGGMFLGVLVTLVAIRMSSSSHFPSAADIHPEMHVWQLSQSTNPNSPRLILRLNKTAAEFVGHPHYPFQFYLTVPITAPKPDGLPARPEHDALAELEQTACNTLEQANESLLVAVVTTEAKKDMIFYTSDPEQAEIKISKLRKTFPSYHLDFEAQRDPTWRVYKNFQ